MLLLGFRLLLDLARVQVVLDGEASATGDRDEAESVPGVSPSQLLLQLADELEGLLVVLVVRLDVARHAPDDRMLTPLPSRPYVERRHPVKEGYYLFLAVVHRFPLVARGFFS